MAAEELHVVSAEQCRVHFGQLQSATASEPGMREARMHNELTEFAYKFGAMNMDMVSSEFEHKAKQCETSVSC